MQIKKKRRVIAPMLLPVQEKKEAPCPFPKKRVSYCRAPPGKKGEKKTALPQIGDAGKKQWQRLLDQEKRIKAGIKPKYKKTKKEKEKEKARKSKKKVRKSMKKSRKSKKKKKYNPDAPFWS